MSVALYSAYPLSLDIGYKQRTKPIPSQPNGFMANVDPMLEQQIFKVPQRQRISQIEHDHHSDQFGRRVEIGGRILGLTYPRRLAVRTLHCHPLTAALPGKRDRLAVTTAE